jgi:hypothetical protein
MGTAKKIKKNHKERLILKLIFDYLHRLHKKRVSFKRLYEHVEREDLHGTFFINFLNIFKYLKNAFQIKKAYVASQAKMPCPKNKTFLWS